MTIDALQERLDEWARELSVPGAAVGIVDGATEHVLTTGVASIATGAAVTGDTLFQIGSTSKTVTATAAMRLVQDGAFTLDTPVRELLPDLRLSDPDALAALRVRHLLTHSGGFVGDADDEESWDDDALTRSIAGYADLPQVFAPGAIASYSNSGLRLVGMIVAAVTGKPFEKAIAEMVFEPLGMSDSLYLPWEILNRPHVVGHVVADDGPRVAPIWGLTRQIAPEGGIGSSVRDQLRYARFQLRGESAGAAPLSDETRLLMQSPQLPASPPLDAVGLPWLLRRQGAARIVEHGGNIGNLQLSAFALAPDQDLAVTTLTNSVGGKELGTRVLTWALEHLRGIAPEEPSPVPDAADADDVLGSYDLNQWKYHVAREGAELVISAELSPELVEAGMPGFPIIRARLGEDRVLRSAGRPVGRFLRLDGDREFLHLGMRAAPRI